MFSQLSNAEQAWKSKNKQQQQQQQQQHKLFCGCELEHNSQLS